MTQDRPREAIFVTGAHGFLGRTVVKALEAKGFKGLILLSRSKRDAPAGLSATNLQGDLGSPEVYAPALSRCRVVIHLAALTGKAPREAYVRENVTATKRLLDAAKAAQVPHVIFVSSVAARVGDPKTYPYAASKAEAEALVRESGLDAAILRPTIILGPGSPAFANFQKLAGGRSVLVFGTGRVKVQPVDVRDVGEVIADLAGRERLPAEAIELGGKEVLSMQDLLIRVRKVIRREPAPVRRIPLGPLLFALPLLERIALGVVPLTRGQLTPFRVDTTALPSPWMNHWSPGFRSLEETLEACVQER